MKQNDILNNSLLYLTNTVNALRIHVYINVLLFVGTGRMKYGLIKEGNGLKTSGLIYKSYMCFTCLLLSVHKNT